MKTASQLQFRKNAGQLIHVGLKLVEDDVADDAPVGILILMNQTMAHTGDLAPRDFGMRSFQLFGQVIGVLADVVKRGGNRPLDGIVAENLFLRDVVFTDVAQQLACHVDDLFETDAIRLIH